MGASVVGLWERAVKLLHNGTKDQASCSDPSMWTNVEALEYKLHNIPPLPKATLKKLVLQLQVPLHVGVAFGKAARHGWSSPGTCAALCVLHSLFNTAAASGLMKDGAAASNLSTSMRQQLQQAGVLQHLTVVMAALAADLRSEAAALAGQSSDELCANLGRFAVCNSSAAQHQLDLVRHLLLALRDLSSSAGQTASASCHAWLCDPSSGHVEAIMQLCTAALQHSSSALQHLVPALQQRVPQQADALLQGLQQRTTAALALGESLAMMICEAEQYRAPACKAQAQQGEQQLQPLQRLLLSPHCLPFLATSVALNSSLFDISCSQIAARGSQGLQNSSAGGTSSSRGSKSSSSSMGASGGGTDRFKHHGGSSSSSSSSSSSESARSDALTPIQLQLFELLGLAPQLTAVAKQLPSPMEMASRLVAGPYVTAMYHQAVSILFDSDSNQGGQGQMEGGEPLDEQRWRFEQQLWLLLPSVLLPSAHNLLLLGSSTMAGSAQQHRQSSGDCGRSEAFARGLVEVSNSALYGYSMMTCLDSSPLQWPPDLAWAGELLDGALRLANQLLLQQPSQAEPRAKTAAGSGSFEMDHITPAATPAVPVSSNASSSDEPATWGWRASCAGEVVQLLTHLVYDISTWTCDCGSTASPLRQPSSDNKDAAPVEVSHAAAVPLVAGKFVEVCTALEAALRTVTTAVQSGQHIEIPAFAPCLVKLLLGSNDIDDVRPELARHIGLHGPAVLAVELRQFYSVLRTVQKLGRCRLGPGDKLCWEQHVADTCCWASARAAVASTAAASRAAAAAAAPTACEQAQDVPAEAEGLYLPSLVILGQCCLGWAEQLNQQAPKLLLLLAPGAAAPEQEQEGVHVSYRSACICIPGWREGQPTATADPCGLEELLATVAAWVGAATSPATHAALAAAAGGDRQSFKQQLDALSAAQQLVRQEGVSDASLAALVQELQAAGVMLTSIAVPQFCNNPTCVNISGPTEVQLVSGRSCICAGCHTARYCGRGCQRQAWRQHKPVCKALAAAAAAGCTN